MRFVFIDRILKFEKNTKATMIKNISSSEDYFSDHFPGFPVVPGALIIEALEEASMLLISASCDFKVLSILKNVSNAKFRRLVRPGDQLLLTVQMESRQGDIAKIAGTARVNQEFAVKLHFVFAVHDVMESEDLVMSAKRMENFYKTLISLDKKKVGGTWVSE